MNEMEQQVDGKTAGAVRKRVMNLDSVTLKVRLDVHGDAYEREPGQAPAASMHPGRADPFLS